MSTVAHQAGAAVDAASDEDLYSLWHKRDTLGAPRFVHVVEGLLLAAMADRGLDPPPLEAETRPAAPLAPTADRDAEIVAAVLDGEPAKAVAERHGLSAGHVRRLTAEARAAARMTPAAQPRPALRVVRDDAEPLPEPDAEPAPLPGTTDAVGWPVGLPAADTSGDPDTAPETPNLLGVAYADKVNFVSSHPGLGKSWVMLAMAAEVIDGARRVLWLDGEDQPGVFTRRLHTLGRGDVAASVFTRWVDASDWRTGEPEDIAAAAAWAANGPAGPGHVFVDAASSTGAGETGESFATWRHKFLEPFTRLGVGVTVADHLAKRRDADRLDSPLGSIQKVAAVTGASVELRGAAWTPRKPGTVAVVVRKDRPGGLGQVGATVARIVGTPDPDTGTLRLEVTEPADAPEHTTRTVDRVWALLERDGERNTTQIVAALEARAQDVRAALNHLIDRGEVGVRTGPKNARLYSLVDPGSTLFDPAEDDP